MPVIEVPDTDTTTVTFMLSGKRRVVLRAATGLDMIRANKEAGEDATPAEMLYHLLARCISVDGKRLTADAIMHLSLGAIKKITGEFNKLNDDIPDAEEEEGEKPPSPEEPVH